MHDAMRAALTEAERARVDDLLSLPQSVKPAEDFLAGEFIQVAGTIPLGNARRLTRGVYCVTRWRPDALELMRFRTRKRIEVPHGLMLTKYPLELVVMSERAAARLVVDGATA